MMENNEEIESNMFTSLQVLILLRRNKIFMFSIQVVVIAKCIFS